MHACLSLCLSLRMDKSELTWSELSESKAIDTDDYLILAFLCLFKTNNCMFVR